MNKGRPGPGHGPGHGPKGMGPRGSMKGQWKQLGRIMGYMLRNYKWLFAIVLVCILVTALCTIQATLFLQVLIDDYILPMLSTVQAGGTVDYGPLATALIRLACVLMLGVVTSYAYNRIMAVIGQGTMH